MEEKFYKIIKKWVGENYGTNEADDPSWNIIELAKVVAGEYYRLKEEEEMQYLTTDVAEVAENMGRELTLKEAQAVADKYRFSESYCARDDESIKWFIEEYA